MNTYLPGVNFRSRISRQTRTVPESLPLQLGKREILRRTLGMNQSLQCVRGLLWITTDRDQTDILLRSGQEYVAQYSVVLVVEALEESVVNWCR